jgi:nucleoside-diphosphate-sugar epimerase
MTDVRPGESRQRSAAKEAPSSEATSWATSGSTGRVLLSGAAGFVGSHLADRLLDDGFEVIGIDNLLTGRRENLAPAESRAAFRLTVADVCEPLEVGGSLAWILHLASPASPEAYRRYPMETLRANGEGTYRLLELARRRGAGFLLASSSEVYGEAEVHPQSEAYVGHVDPVGPRSAYQEAKRYAEAMATAAARDWGIPVRIARIFNAYGPRMAPDDGRVVSTFIGQALRGEPLTLHGDGSQTRSFQYIDDLVTGLRRLMHVDHSAPVNLGSSDERSIRELAELVLEVTASPSTILSGATPADGARRRRPDGGLARSVLGWEPVVPLRVGLERTVTDARARLAEAQPAGSGGTAGRATGA